MNDKKTKSAIAKLNDPHSVSDIVWPPMKKAIWDQVIAVNLNGGKYINAWDLTENIYAAVKPYEAVE